MAETDQIRRIVTLVYVAMIAAVGVCFLVVAVVPAPRTGSPPSSSVRWILLALGVGEYLFATVLSRRRSFAGARGALERIRSGFLIRYAAAQAIAAFGIMIHFLGSPPSSVFPFLCVSIAALALSYPSRRAFRTTKS